jgi:hypothetical protein
MICEKCQGTGCGNSKRYIEKLPCPDCMGTGISYCCDEAGANPPNSFDAVDKRSTHEAHQTGPALSPEFWDSDLGKPFGDVNGC